MLNTENAFLKEKIESFQKLNGTDSQTDFFEKINADFKDLNKKEQEEIKLAFKKNLDEISTHLIQLEKKVNNIPIKVFPKTIEEKAKLISLFRAMDISFK